MSHYKSITIKVKVHENFTKKFFYKIARRCKNILLSLYIILGIYIYIHTTYIFTYKVYIRVHRTTRMRICSHWAIRTRSSGDIVREIFSREGGSPASWSAFIHNYEMRVRAYGLRHVARSRLTERRNERERKKVTEKKEKTKKKKKEGRSLCARERGKYPDRRRSRRLEYQANDPCNSVPCDRAHADAREIPGRQISRKISLERRETMESQEIKSSRISVTACTYTGITAGIVQARRYLRMFAAFITPPPLCARARERDISHVDTY